VRKLIRFFVACTAVGVIATGTAACKSATPYAAKVNGATITKADFDGELEAIRDNKKFREAVEQSLPVKGTGDDTFNQAFVAQILTRRIYFTLVHQEFERRNLKVTSRDLEISRREILQQLQGDQEMLDGFRKDYQTWLIRVNAEVSVLANKLADTSDSNLHAYYEAHKDQFENVCAAHILVDTKAQADTLEKQIAKAKDKNATFADLAKSKSKDTGSGAKGGDLGCAAPSNYVSAFKDAVRTQKVGVIGQPVKSEFGYHIIRVDSREAAKPFDEVKEEVKTAITDSQQGAFNTFVTTGMKDAKVEVNPRYGTYDTSGQQPEIVPPKTPDAATSNPGG
jgi:foldase protein PrsA